MTDGVVGIREQERLICRQLERVGRKTWEGKVLSNTLDKWVINSKYLKIISSLKVELNSKVVTWLAATARPCRLVTQLSQRSWEGERLLGLCSETLWAVMQLCVVVKGTVCPGVCGMGGSQQASEWHMVCIAWGSRDFSNRCLDRKEIGRCLLCLKWSNCWASTFQRIAVSFKCERGLFVARSCQNLSRNRI